MRIFPRILSAALSVAMVCAAVGCGGSGDRGDADAVVKNDDENSITCMVWDRDNFPEGYDCNTNALAKWIKGKVKDACGVDVQFVSVPRKNSDDTLKKLEAEGKLPDIFFTYSASMFGYMTKQGKIADLTDSYKQYGKNISEYIGEIQYKGLYNDLQTAIMKRRGIQLPRHMAYIRKDWCDALGMEVPKTKKELIRYLYAVRDKNPGGVDGVIPWGIGGETTTEKYYQGFVGSYVGELEERDSFIYSERYLVAKDEAKEGLKIMNGLYNDGILSLDFAADVDGSKFRKDVKSGKVGFFIEDTTRVFEFIPELKKNCPTAELVPVLCFDLPDGSYRNVAEPLYGLYIMVPASSRNKTDAIMKYLNWLADPVNAEMVSYTPDHEETSAGAPKTMSKEELLEYGYPGNPEDYSIVNSQFEFTQDREKMISTWESEENWESHEWFENFYDLCTTDQFVFPSANWVLENESKYQLDLDSKLVAFSYNLICCPSDEFESEYEEEHKMLINTGLEDVLSERAEFYDSGEFRSGQ